jgi:hypothetical protein
VGPAHHRRIGLGAGTRDEDRDEPVRVVEQPRAGGSQLEGEPGIDHVAARQAEMQVAALRPDRLRDLAHERDDVVVRRALDLGDPVDVDRRPGLDRL